MRARRLCRCDYDVMAPFRRQPDQSATIDIGPGPIKRKTVNGVVLTLEQVRARVEPRS
jgi:hypothetical protein